MNPELNRPIVEQALRVLDTHAETYGFDTKPLWHALTHALSSWDNGTPSPDDFRYVLPSTPPDIVSHFVNGKPQELAVGCLAVGYSYTLTPGQRSILRDTYGLTPTQTVTCTYLETWPASAHPRVLKLQSDLHVDPRNRKHILVSAVIHNVGTFFKNAAELDAEDRVEQKFSFSRATASVGRLFTIESEEKWALEDLSGVKDISKKIELVKLHDDGATVMCMKTGKQVRVKWADYEPLVQEYITLHKTTKRKRSTSDSDARTLQQMIDSLV